MMKGGSSQKGAGGTSGQSVPKFRQKSEQERVAASKLRMEQTGEKLEAACDKLAKQKPPQKPGKIKRAGQAAGGAAYGFVHGKVYSVEHENVGTEGAHRTELVGEAALRQGKHTVKKAIREHPRKAVRKTEAKHLRAKATYQYRAAAQERPELNQNAVSRLWYRHRLKKQYQKQAREAAKQGAKGAGKTVGMAQRLSAHTVGYVKRHPAGCLLALFCILLLLVMQSCMSSMLTLGNGAVGAMGASSYPSEDAQMHSAEAAYLALEAELQSYLDDYEHTHSYDEYRYSLDDIDHDPYVLISMLSAFHEGAWTVSEVQSTLQMLFDKQYILTEHVVTEVRYRTENRTDSEGNPYTVRVPYNYYICTVTLDNFDLSHVPIYTMGEAQLSRYALYMGALGNRPDLFPTSGYIAKYITNPPPPYQVPETHLADETFAAILTEAEKYIGYPYVWGGYNPSTSFDCSGYVSWVINQSGWDVGRLGAQSLYNICTPTSAPHPGDLVFFTGTYDTPGVSHVGIYVGDSMMLHCGDPIGYANLNSSYWQTHFCAYGRLP